MSPRRSKPLFRYRLTRLGLHFLFVALFAIIGGSLRGFNLLLVLAGLLIAILIIQWRQGRGAIRRTRLKRHHVHGGHAGTPMVMRYEVCNAGRWLPIWAIRIEDRVSETVSGTGSAEKAVPAELVGGIGYVPAGQTRCTTVICRISRRGLYQWGPVVTLTTFPFCLMSCERLSVGSIESIYVYPRLIELRRGWQTLLPPRRGGDGDRSTGGTNLDGEFFGLRPWQSGDHIKHIHWRTTARIGQPAVRQFEQRNRHQLCMIVDGSPSADFELVLRLAATLVNELSAQTRWVAMIVADQLTSNTPDLKELIVSRGADASMMMKRLAIALPSTHPPDDDPLARVVAGLSGQFRGFDVIVVSGRSLNEIRSRAPHASETWSKALAVLRFLDQARRLSWLDVNSKTVRRIAGVNSPPTVGQMGLHPQEAADVRR
jgi:uncharacterized protein (DUF58 family)